MCDYCKETLGNLCLSHEIKNCPLRKGSYCPICASYGHSLRTCKEELKSEPEYLEQLIPPSLLQANNITSATPIVSEDKKVWYIKAAKACIDIPDDPKAIRAFLKANNSLPEKDNRSKHKYKDELEIFASKVNSTIHYIPTV